MSSAPHSGTHVRGREAHGVANRSLRTRKTGNKSRKVSAPNSGAKSPKVKETAPAKPVITKEEEDIGNNINQNTDIEDKSQDGNATTNTDVTDTGGRDSVMTDIVTSPDDNNNAYTEGRPTQEDNMHSPAPEVVQEESLLEPPAPPRPLSSYCEVIDPEDFDSKSFLNAVNELSVTLQSDYYKYIDADFSAEDLKAMVSAVASTMNNFQNYVTYTQKQMECLRDQMKTIKDKMHRRVQQKAYDPSSASMRMGLDERELEAKLALLNKELAKAAEELVRASSISVESESAAVQAALVAERAAEEAAKIQAEYEARRMADLEARRREEERKRHEEEKRQMERKRAEEARRREEERRNRIRGGSAKPRAEVWKDWPVYNYSKRAGDFDHGIACLIRADPRLVKESWIKCDVVDQLNSTFPYSDNNELISSIISLRPLDEGNTLPAPVYVAIPHCMARANNLTKEPVIKAEIDGKWVELQTNEVTIEDRKDVKFVQAEIKSFTAMVVVTRFKKDYLQISKRGGKCISNVDSRVTFLAQRGTFKTTENIMLQLQPADTASVHEVKACPAGKGLLCSTSIVNMEWTVNRFELPVTMTLPCPSNPAKAKKAAAIKAAKEAKMKNPGPSPLEMLEMAKKQEEQKEKQQAPPKNNWYMGSYGTTDDDEKDLLYLVVKQKSGKWTVMDDTDILQARLDLLQFELLEPYERFMVLRTRTNVNAREAQVMASSIEEQLAKKPVSVVVRQRSEDLTDMTLHVVPSKRCERLIKKLTDKGYDEGPSHSPHLMLHEGDVLEVSFRGNITTGDEDITSMSLVYNSNLGTSTEFYVKEVDRFLQKTYPVFRGFIQLFREVRTVYQPTKADIEEGRTQPWTEVTKEMLTEILTSIPKELPEATPRTTFNKVPIIIRNDKDPINEEILQDLAAELGDEWQRLAQVLGVKRVRIQAILRSAAQNEEEDAKYEMLLSWVKRVPRGMAKVPILYEALIRSGRTDLAERLHDLDKDFRSQRNQRKR